jgi:hypothetical protein
MKTTIILLIALLLCYFIPCYVVWEFNPAKLNLFVRYVQMMCLFVISMIGLFIYLDEK